MFCANKLKQKIKINSEPDSKTIKYLAQVVYIFAKWNKQNKNKRVFYFLTPD